MQEDSYRRLKTCTTTTARPRAAGAWLPRLICLPLVRGSSRLYHEEKIPRTCVCTLLVARLFRGYSSELLEKIDT